jgi:hypothetical protein
MLGVVDVADVAAGAALQAQRGQCACVRVGDRVTFFG